MTDEEYEATVRQILLVAGVVADLDVPGVLERIGTAHAVGPFLDPTAYREAGARLDQVEGLARALVPFATRARAVKAEILEGSG